MRVLLTVHGYPPSHSAGAERQAERMAQWLTRHGHHVEVFAVEQLDAPFRIDTSEQDGVTVHRIFYDLRGKDDAFTNSYDHPQIGIALRQVLAQRNFDLIHVISGYLMGGQVIHTAHEAGLPVVISPMEYWFLCTRLNLLQITGSLCSGPESDEKCMRCLMEDKRRYRRPAEVAPVMMDAFWTVARHLPFAHHTTDAIIRRRITLQNALNAADLVICNSRFLIEKFGEFGFDTRRYIHIRQGLASTGDVKPVPTPRPDKTLRVGYVGQIKPHKGIDLLIEAVLKLINAGTPISLNLWGNETEDRIYTETLKSRSVNYPAIQWNGPYTGAKVWDVLASLDTLVIPSRWYENSPNVILEAFEMRLPVIVANLGGMAELVEHEKSGLHFQHNNVSNLAHQLQRLFDEPALLAQLQNGIPVVKTIDEEMEAVVAEYRQLLTTHRVPAA